MSIGIGQILLILFIVLFLFGKFPKLMDDLTKGINNFRKGINYTEKKETKQISSKKDN